LKEIAEFLISSGKKQYELAAEIGIPPQTLNRWLKGRTKVSNAYTKILRQKGIIK